MPSTIAIIKVIYSNQFKCIYLLNILNKKLEPHCLSIFEIIHSEKYGYLNE